MDHVVYVDAKAKELDLLLSGKKTMIIRGATGRKLPYGRLTVGDILYFINNNAEGTIKAKAKVLTVTNSEKLDTEESRHVVESHQKQLQLTPKQFARWAGKRYLVLIEIAEVQTIPVTPIDRSGYSTMDDWLPVGDIRSVSKI